MKVAGQVIKRHRLNHGLSQQCLAKGICAQATVSLIENQNNCPKLDILVKISHRLNIPITLIANVSAYTMKIEQEILNGKYTKAKAKLLRLSQRKFQFNQQLDRYFCYWGVLSLVEHKELDGLYFFNKVLNLDSKVTSNYYRGWAKIGIGQLYLKQHDVNKALEFAESAIHDVDIQLNHNLHYRVRLYVELRLKLADLLTKLNQFTQSNTVCFATIKELVTINSIYRLVDIYMQINRNYTKLNGVKFAKLALNHAKFFCQIHQKPKLLFLYKYN